MGITLRISFLQRILILTVSVILISFFVYSRFSCDNPTYHGKPFKYWIALSGNPDHSRSTVPVLIDALGDWSVSVRVGAATALGRIGPRAADAAGPLADRTEDWCSYVRDASIDALGDIGPVGISALSERLSCQNAKVRRLVAAKLVENSPLGGEKVVRNLIGALSDNDGLVRYSAARALGMVRPPPLWAAPILRQMLNDKYTFARLAAAEALCLIGDECGECIPAIRREIENEDQDVRIAAALSLLNLNQYDEKVEGVLKQIATNVTYDRGIRCQAIWGMWKYTPPLKEAEITCKNLIGDPNWLVSTTAVEALIDRKCEAHEISDFLIRTLCEHSSFGMRRWAAEILGKSNFATRAAIEALNRAKDDPDDEVRNAAVHALKKLTDNKLDRAH